MATCGVPLGPAWSQDHAGIGRIRISGFPDPENPEKPEIRKKSHVTYQIKALCKLVNMDTLKSGFPDSRSGKSGKTGNPRIWRSVRADQKQLPASSNDTPEIC